MNSLTPLEQDLISRFIHDVSGIPYIMEIFLFGSRFKGFSAEESDLDIGVIVEDRGYIRETEKYLENWLSSVSDDYFGVLFHPVVLSEDMLDKSFLGTEIKKGAILWQSKELKKALKTS